MLDSGRTDGVGAGSRCAAAVEGRNLRLTDGGPMELRGKYVVGLGEWDGVEGPLLEAVARAAGAVDVFAFTRCFY